MKRIINAIVGKLGYVIGLGIASVIGGLASAVVLAAIPDTTGTIHGCSNKLTGALKVVDSENSETCDALQEDTVNWSQGGKTLRDGNGQALGTLLNVGTPSMEGTQTTVFNDSLKRTVLFNFMSGDSEARIGQLNYPSYTSTDCSGTGYVQNIDLVPLKTVLFRSAYTGTPTYFKVADNAVSSSVTIRSHMGSGGYGRPDVCYEDESFEGDYFTITPVTLPFTVPLSAPFKF